ncbi:Uma2 family endonuclease [Nocardia pseudovaccinii]|uniref:Uma2 family endonuclease n=1 Tax=Nocardia pseudovaccinii TaxID=189540 RepID=UPI000AACA7E1|nr:Uma2 family endonuclease [Nocardia pseudovaccinii]
MHWPDHLLTLDDWIALPEDNSRGYELVAGVLIVSPRPMAKRQDAVWRLAAQLQPQLPTVWDVVIQAELVIDPSSPSTVRVPDAMAVRREALERNLPRFDPGDVLLAVEIIAVGSKRTDTVTKFAEYCRGSV